MRKIVALACISLLLQSCKKSKEYIDPDHVVATVIVNGSSSSIDATGGNASIDRYEAYVVNTPHIGISGWSSSNTKVYITMPDPVAVGTFPITVGGDFTAAYQDVNTGFTYNSTDTSGLVTIESYSHTNIKGSFYFKGYTSTGQEAIISNGSFEGDLEN